jgi:ParB family transcriptional regulator, chromosome partitioning protein
MSNESSIEMIPLSQLVAGEEVNVRKTDREEGVKALAKSIAAHGLIHPLEVRLTEGRYEVVDGNRRLAAIQKNAGKKDTQVMCRIVQSGDTEARERSLAANVMRVNLHPVDEFEAYAGLVHLGMTEAQVADRYGVTALDVKKRLRLAELAVAVRTAWRDGKIDGEQARAFAASSDTVEQGEMLKRVLKSKNEWERTASAIRRELTQRFLTAGDKRIEFIGGINLYTAAGGRIETDLFADKTHLIDRNIVEQLVDEKLRARAARLTTKEGWGWVKIASEIDPEDRHWNWPEADLSPHATEDERKALTQPSYTDKHRRATEAILQRLEADPAFKAAHGLVIAYQHGKFDIDGPYSRASGLTDEEKAEREKSEQDAEGSRKSEPEPAEPEGPQTPWPVREALSLALTQVASQMVSERWHQALVAMTATLRVRLRHRGATPLRIDPDHKRLHQLRPEQSDDRLDWGKAYGEMWTTPIEDIQKEFAGYVASLLDLVDRKLDDRNHHGFDLASATADLVASLPPDEFNRRLGEAFDADAYFAKVPVPLIDAALIEMTGFPSKNAQKKAEKAQCAAGIATARGWLPPELRTQHYAPVIPEHHKDAAE